MIAHYRAIRTYEVHEITQPNGRHVIDVFRRGVLVSHFAARNREDALVKLYRAGYHPQKSEDTKGD